MAQTAAQLVDHVIPQVPVRQWVLSLPIPLRLLLAALPQLLTPVLQVVHRAITQIQRFRSAAKLSLRLHCLVLDGVYRRSADGEPQFVGVPTPSDEAVQAVLHQIIGRILKRLTRQGVLIEEQGETYLAGNECDSDKARALGRIDGASAKR